MKVIYLYPTMHNAGGIERVLTVKLNYLADILNYEIVLVNYRQRKRNNFFNLSPKIKQIDLELEDPTFFLNYILLKRMPISNPFLALKIIFITEKN